MTGTNNTNGEKKYGGHSHYGTLKRVIVKRPDQTQDVDPTKWHYASPIDISVAQQEHDQLVKYLKDEGVEVIYHTIDVAKGLSDSIFTQDSSIITDHGAIILRMGKEARRGEEDEIMRLYESIHVPILGRLSGSATVEGGDTFWVDEKTLAIGLGFRSNEEGVRQIQAMLSPFGVSVVGYHLPYYTGPDACLHLTSLISHITPKVAVVHLPLLPVKLWKLLTAQGVKLIDSPLDEFEKTLTVSANVLGIGNNKAIMLSKCPKTKAAIEAEGITVYEYKGDELSVKMEGGATCLTRPLLRL
eukprot:TRINITY_DN648_c0_g2_i2.p1 TRINITY_DN648_c0_g2~~TRINITY_DN648_c0_g2_i2.p1  ORF type:complete len:300 (-),score=103.16 TRINITY_DN648_c0_g2_i2:33-932(-)